MWLLRRFVLDFSLGIPLSSYFQTADMMKKGYQMGHTEQSALKVARQGVLNGLTYTPKPSFRALASVAAVFRDGVRPVAGPVFSAKQETGADWPEIGGSTVRCHAFARGRTPLYVYYMASDPQRMWQDKRARTTLAIASRDDLDAVRSPVLVNLLTGDVFALSLRTDPATPGALFVDGLPLSDVPMLVCDRSAIELGR